jgi:hypothetical protein
MRSEVWELRQSLTTQQPENAAEYVEGAAEF